MNRTAAGAFDQRKSFSILFLLMIAAVIGWMAMAVSAQALTPSTVAGDVVSVSPEKIVLSAKTGMMDIILSGKTTYKRVDAEKPSLKTATDAALSDIKPGDRLLVTG